MALKQFKPVSHLNPRAISLWAGVFAVIGVTTLLLTRAATPGMQVTIDSTLPNPTNVKTYADDRVATVTWDPVADPASKSIVGYYVSWGTGSTYTSARQTQYNAIQIQPLINGTLYNVKVQAVQGSKVRVPTPGAHDPVDYGSDPNADEYRSNGKVSTGVTATVTANGARVDQLRSQMTGFFDDFNTPSGAFDELKWNTAGSSCVYPGQLGSFINNQLHAHSQTRSTIGAPYTYCDRGQVVNRPRPTFDITGKTEANPGVLVFDFDGSSRSRDDWYVDLIPLSVRKSGAPLDINSHDSIFQDDTNDPMLLRFVQSVGGLKLTSYNTNKQPQGLDMTYIACNDGTGTFYFDRCGGLTQRTDLSPLPELPISSSVGAVIPNVRRHYRLEVSPTKVKVFLDGYKMLEANMPSYFTNVKQWTVQNTTFSYNTGKDDSANPTTEILHWDNFGYNGAAPTTVVHNYIDGSSTGTVPFIGRGLAANPVPVGKRLSKINIPDPIGTPVKARLMFTFGAFGYQTYRWTSADHVIINGKRYNYPNPQTDSVLPPSLGDSTADGYKPFADSIALTAADLKQGVNDVQLNLLNGEEAAVMNVHIELEYPNGSAPAYTSPTQIFGSSALMAVLQPPMAAHDNYLFVEQDFGLPSGPLDSGTPVDPPTGGDTTKPIISLTAPANNSTVTVGTNVSASANASDNVGVTKVEFYLGNVLKQTDTVSPYTASISTTGMTPGTYNVTAMAYDLAGNTTTSTSASVTVQAVVTPPASGKCDFNSDGHVTITDLSMLLSKYGTTVTANSVGDCDGNGQVNITDLSKLLSQYGT